MFCYQLIITITISHKKVDAFIWKSVGDDSKDMEGTMEKEGLGSFNDNGENYVISAQWTALSTQEQLKATWVSPKGRMQIKSNWSLDDP